MDSITHALYKAIAADNAHQRKCDRPGLQNLPDDQQEDIRVRDLYISLERGDELLALQLEFIAAGFTPPAGLYLHGAEVVISPGRIDVTAPLDFGKGVWTATLMRYDEDPRSRKASWQEQVL